MCSLRSPTTSSYGKTDERAKFRKYPRLLEAMEKKGYFDMTSEERIRKAMEITRKLVGSGVGDYEAGKEALNEMRGGWIV